MKKIVPHLWFEKDVVEAAQWYASLFEDSAVKSVQRITGTPSGDVDIVDFRLANLDFEAINGGPYFRFNSSISFMVACRAVEEVDRLHAQLSAGGMELMPLGEYPFSKRYSWLKDRYGLNWQLMLSDAEVKHKIRPTLLFAGDACGRAEDAMEFYRSVLPGSSFGYLNYYQLGEAADARARINYGEFNAGGIQLVTMDHGMGGEDAFNEAISLMVLCEDQQEIDEYWRKLSHVPEAEQCGWLKDRFGLSWQIVPANMGELLAGGNAEEIARVTAAMLQMKKIDIQTLMDARNG